MTIATSTSAPGASSTTRTFTLSDFDFALPQQLIAQHPAPERTGSRLLDGTASTAATPQDRIFKDFPSLLR
jgi:S-adenosylmethionine:tRNA ribosyltransferase-isomerase